ncbi:MAG: GNAT family protein [Chloroflexota bacterium]
MNVEPTSPRPLPTIRGEQVYLRPAEREDIDLFVRWFADAETTRFLSVKAPFSKAMEEKWFESMVEQQGKRQYHFVICLLADDRAIGTAGFHHVNQEDGNASFGISIGEKAEWSKGYGTDALRAICDFGFGQLRLERIELDVYESNKRAQRSYEKAGFITEGIIRHAQFTDGRFQDLRRMAFLREEWAAQPQRRPWDESTSADGA